MKRLLLGAILLLSTTNAFSQNNTIEGKWKMQNFDNTLYIFETAIEHNQRILTKQHN